MSTSKLLNPMVAAAAALVIATGLFALTISRQTPVGALNGMVVAQESGNPLDMSLYLRPSGEPEYGSTTRYTESVGGKFSFSSLPVGEYILQVNSNWRQSPPIRVTIQEGKTEDLNIELPPGEPKLDLYVHQHIFTPDERAQVTCQGYVEPNALDVRVYKVDLGAFLLTAHGDLRRLVGLESYYGNSPEKSKIDLSANPNLKLADSFISPITKRESEGNFTQRIGLPALTPGLYVVAVRGGEVQQLGWIMVTSLGLVTKNAGPELLTFAVDLKTGAAVANADVSVYSDSSAIASGKTGSDGILKLTLPSGGGSHGEKTIIARSGDSFAFVSASISSREESKQLVYAYTDRPVYRPGQQVYFKGIVRSSEGDHYAVPAGKQVSVEVRDPNDTLIYRATKTIDRFGTYHGRVDLNRETSTGTYSIVTSIGGSKVGGGDEGGDSEYGGSERGATFQVAAYAKPEFTVKVTFPKKRYIRGDQVTAKIAAAYYFGAPVANATVNYTVRRANYWLYEGEDEEEESTEGYRDYGGYGEFVEQHEAETDADGELVITFPADWTQPEGEYDWDADQQFTVEAYVIDKSERAVTGSGSVLATRGEFAISVTPESYVVRPGAQDRVEIQAKDYDKHPVRDQQLTVTIGRRVWTGDTSEFQKFEERRVTTDREGHASMQFSVKKTGDIQVVASSHDSKGNEITDSAWIWCYSEAFEEAEGARYPDLQIVTDRKTYSPGDTAHVLINVKKPGATALVTVEGERIYAHQTVTLKGKSTAVDIPVLDAYKPNFYISVCFVQNKNFAEQEARAKVSLGSQTVNVRIEPNKKRYLPGEKAIYKLKATDSKGRPVNAQLSLGVVDEAIYAIAADKTTPILDYFYSKKPNRVSTRFSFPEIYLSDPDKAGMTDKMPRQHGIRLRKRFLDTAFWQPDVVTGPTGEAEVSFQMPDNLTTWRATVRGITTDTLCGQATNTVLAQQDMLVRLETPRFLIQGDTTTIAAVVHNYTGSSDRVRVEFSAPGLSVDGSLKQSIGVANNGSERVDWTVRAPKPGTFAITVTARGSKAGDAMQLTLPVYPHGEERQDTKTGAIGATRSISFAVPVRRDSIPEATRLTIRLAPSLASAMLGSLDYLARYPYDCTEQTTSSFLPDVILSRTFKELGMHNPSLEKKLPDMVQTGLLRLYRFQLEDGGWAWCEYGKADPWMTAYVCFGLIQAKRAGFEVNQDALSHGLEQLGRMLSKPGQKMETQTRAYCYYVLALAGKDVRGELRELTQVYLLPSRSLAELSLAFSESGQPEPARAMLEKLFGRATIEPAFIHWIGGYGYGYGATDIETTALALQAVLRANPKDERAYRIVRWLMAQRQGDYWYSTRDTAMTLYAMADFLKASKELAPDYTAELLVNGKSVGRYRFAKASVFDPDRVVTIPARDLRKGRNEIEIRKSGAGNLYYSAKLTQYVAKKLIPATVTGAGVSISRAYYKPGSRFWEQERASELGSPVTSCSGGDVILVRLTVNASKTLEHLLLEDYIPAGCEIIDKGHVDYYEWYYWYVGRDIRDEKISFYLDVLHPGKYVAEYQMRASVPGDYHAMPAQIFGMYDPAIRASTAESEFTVR